VSPVDRETALQLVALEHYAQDGPNTGTAFHGLFRRDDHMACLGVAWWLPPTRIAAASVWPDDPSAVLALSRLVVLPDVPGNGASFLLAGASRLIGQLPPHLSRAGLAKHWRCLLTYADTRLGHTGAIYRAAGWEYLGLTKPEPAWVDGAGRQVSRKRGPRTLTVTEMAELGYTRVGSFAKHKYRKVLW
jgi:hypothetical protein